MNGHTIAARAAAALVAGAASFSHIADVVRVATPEPVLTVKSQPAQSPANGSGRRGEPVHGAPEPAGTCDGPVILEPPVTLTGS